jgi:cysteine synthase
MMRSSSSFESATAVARSSTSFWSAWARDAPAEQAPAAAQERPVDADVVASDDGALEQRRHLAERGVQRDRVAPGLVGVAVDLEGARVGVRQARAADPERLLREEGLYVGGSVGANLVAALRVAARGDLHGPTQTP